MSKTQNQNTPPENLKINRHFKDLLEKRFQAKGNSENISEALNQLIMLDLEEMYIQARNTGNISAGLKAKELQGKEFGLFIREKRSKIKGVPLKPLTHMSAEELYYLITSTCDELSMNISELVRKEEEKI